MKTNNLTDDDYTLVEGAAWFTVKGFSIRIHSTDEGVIADIFAKGHEMEPCIAGTYAFDSEAEEMGDERPEEGV